VTGNLLRSTALGRTKG